MKYTKHMVKNNYIVTARCEDTLKYFTLHNVCRAHLSRTAECVAKNLFYTDSINIISFEIE